MAAPVVLQIRAEDLASVVLQKLQGEVQKLGPTAAQSATGMQQLGAATDKLQQQTTFGAKTIQAWKEAQQQAGAAAAQSVPHVERLATATETAHGGFLSSAKSALGFATAITGVQLGVAGVGQVLQTTVSGVLNFQAALANVNTLGSSTVEVQERLRQQLLLLPPALGDSVTLAKGLYDVLSAGIPASESVAVLAISANLAKAGLAEVGTTTEALTKTMAAFNIPTKDAGQLADVLFKVVDLGQGTLQQFARAFPQVTQGAAALGLSFIDTAATMATLTQTFKNADTAATGFRSLLGQLVQNSEKFAQSGINIQQVIGEQGIVGALRVLQDLTGGNSEKMRVFVNDVEGLAAAQALTGPQFKLLIENQAKLLDSTGAVAQGVKTQNETLLASIGNLGNAFGTYVTTLTTGNKETSLFQRVLGAFTQGFKEHTAALIAAEERQKAYREEQARLRLGQDQVKISVDDNTKSFRFLGDTYQNTQTYVASYDKTAQKARATIEAKIQATEKEIAILKAEGEGHASTALAVERLSTTLTLSTLELTLSAKAARDFNTDMQTLKANVDAFKPGSFRVVDPIQAEKDVTATIGAIMRLGETGKVNFAELLKRAEGMTEGIRETFGTLPPVWQQFIEYMQERARTELPKIQGLFDTLGIKSKERLQELAIEGGKDLAALVATTQTKSTEALELVHDASGKILIQNKETVDGIGQQIGTSVTVTTANLIAEWHKAIDALNKGEFSQIPPALKATFDQLAPLVKKATGEVVTFTRDDFGIVRGEIEKTATAFQGLGFTLAQTGQEGEALRANFRALTGEADGLEGSIRGLDATAVQLGHTLSAAGTEVNAYGNAIARLSDETQRLNDLQISVKTPFAKDIPGLEAQLLEAQRNFAQIGGPLTAGMSLEARAALQRNYQAIIDQIKALLATARGEAATAPSPGTPVGSPVTPAPPAAARPVTPPSVGGGFGAPGSAPGRLDPTTGRPLTPGVGLLDPNRGTTNPVNPVPVRPTPAPPRLPLPPAGPGGAFPAPGAPIPPGGATFRPPTSPDAVGSLIRVPGGLLSLGGARPGDPRVPVYDLSRATVLSPFEVARLPTAAALPASTPFEAPPPAPPPPRASGQGPQRGGDLSHPGTLPGATLRGRFAAGGLVPGPGGTDSVLIRATPGERVITPEDNSRLMAILERLSTQGGGSTTVHLTVVLPPTWDRLTAQQFVREIGPALNESLDRGHGRFA